MPIVALAPEAMKKINQVQIYGYPVGINYESS